MLTDEPSTFLLEGKFSGSEIEKTPEASGVCGILVRVDRAVDCRSCLFDAGELFNFLLFVKSDFQNVRIFDASCGDDSIFPFAERLGDIDRVVKMYSLEHFFNAF